MARYTVPAHQYQPPLLAGPLLFGRDWAPHHQLSSAPTTVASTPVRGCIALALGHRAPAVQLHCIELLYITTTT
jgi:hypothetical protein